MHETPSRNLSRRKLLTLALGGGAVIAGSGGIWYLSSRHGAARSALVPSNAIPAAGTTLFTYTGHTGPVFSVAWSPNGKRIVSGSWDATAQVWDATKGAVPLVTYTGHTDVIESLVWSPDGRYIASASYDRTVQVWDAAVGGSAILIYK